MGKFLGAHFSETELLIPVLQAGLLVNHAQSNLLALILSNVIDGKTDQLCPVAPMPVGRRDGQPLNIEDALIGWLYGDKANLYLTQKKAEKRSSPALHFLKTGNGEEAGMVRESLPGKT